LWREGKVEVRGVKRGASSLEANLHLFDSVKFVQVDARHCPAEGATSEL